MEKTIYIPGDLVMTNGIPIGTKEGIVYQVTESNADKYAKVKDGNAFTELKGSVTLSNLKGKTIKDDGFLFCDSGAWVKDIVPIPLTPSILEKNGYKQIVNHSYIYQHIENDCYEIWKNVKNWTMYWRGVNLCSFKYLHELQHILLFLGLNSEMEVQRMKIHLCYSSCCCAADEHETGCYPRSSFKPKPELPVGTILTVKEKWQNFYGKYYRCYLPDEMKNKGYSIPYYDIPADKAEVIEL